MVRSERRKRRVDRRSGRWPLRGKSLRYCRYRRCFPQNLFSKCRSGALLLSRDILRRLGSVEIDFADKREEGVASGLRAAIAGTDRPWSQHRYYDWKSGRFDRDLPQPIVRLLAASQ